MLLNTGHVSHLFRVLKIEKIKCAIWYKFGA